MTANELADFVEISKPNDKTHQAIATMLRQQQAEIEALKETRCVACGWNPNLIRGERNDSGFYMSDAEHYKLKCESQQAEIEALKKELALQRLSDFTQEVEAKYSDAWWKEVDEFNKQLKAQEK